MTTVSLKMIHMQFLRGILHLRATLLSAQVLDGISENVSILIIEIFTESLSYHKQENDFIYLQ